MTIFARNGDINLRPNTICRLHLVRSRGLCQKVEGFYIESFKRQVRTLA
jgi:hypothetical protein